MIIKDSIKMIRFTDITIKMIRFTDITINIGVIGLNFVEVVPK